MKHQLEVWGECLTSCQVCGGAEGSMPTDCPGEHMDKLVRQRVYAGSLDFIDGRWAVLPTKGLMIRISRGIVRGCPPGAVDPYVDENKPFNGPVVQWSADAVAS